MIFSLALETYPSEIDFSARQTRTDSHRIDAGCPLPTIMAEPPEQSLKFSQLSHVRTAYRLVNFSHGRIGDRAAGAVTFMLAAVAAFLTTKIANALVTYDFPNWFPFVLFVGFWIGIMFWWTSILNKTIAQINIAAVGDGHPWHPSEETGNTAVYVLNSGDEWYKIPAKARIYPQQDPILSQTILRRDDVDGKLLTRLDGNLDKNMRKLLGLVNIALALRDAQERAEDAEDPFEAARAREDGESILDHRTWEATEAGSMTPEPGALLRRVRSEASDILKLDDDD